MVEVAREGRGRRASTGPVTRVPPRTVLLHCPTVPGGDARPNLLCVPTPTPHGEALVVFSSRKIARDALSSDEFPGGCAARVCSGGEFVSLLYGPYRDVEWVLFDPLPGEDDAAHLVSRGCFMDYLLGASALPHQN